MPALSFTDSGAVDSVPTESWPFAWAGFTVQKVAALAPLEAEWRKLEPFSISSMFQAYDYLNAWVEEAAAEIGEEPVFFVGRKGAEVAFILPMAVTRRWGVRSLGWLGQSHSNYGMGVFNPKVQPIEPHEIADLISGLAKRMGVALVHLDRQPEHWEGRSNPFAQTPQNHKTANDTFVVHLEDDYDAHHGRLFSGRTMSGLKRKQRKMEEGGTASFLRPEPGPDRVRVMDWFFLEKCSQLAQSGRPSPFDPPYIQSLYHRLAKSAGDYDVDTLMIDGNYVAMGMSAHQKGITYLINTVYVGGEFARFSPGTLLTHRTVAQAHARGDRTYDFGPGLLPYKLEWEPEVIPLNAAVYLVNPAGLFAYWATLLLSKGKSWVKRSKNLSNFVNSVRKIKNNHQH